MTSNDDARVDASAAISKPRRRRKPQQSSRVVSDLVESALAAKQQEEERALAAQTRHRRKRAFRKPKGLKQHLGGARGAGTGADADTGGDASSCQPPDVCSASSGAGITSGSDSDAFVVVLENLVDPEELEDSDEYDDVVADLEIDFQSYGDLVSLQVSRETGFIALQFANGDSAGAVVREKHGKLFGGRQAVARLVQREEGNLPPVTAPSPPSHTVEASPYNETETQAQTQGANVDPVAQKKKKRRSKCKNAMLQEREKTETKLSAGLVASAGSRDVVRCEFIVCNLIASDEIEDEDEFEELQSDTRADFEKFGALTHLEVATRGHDSVYDIFHQNDPTTTSANLIASPGNVAVEYAHPDCAAAAFCAYNDRVFGGRVVKCHWVLPASPPANSISTTSILVENMLSPEELEDDDEFEDIRDEVADLFARYGAVQSLVISRPIGTITVVYEALEAAQQAVAKMNQSVYGGRSVKVSLLANGGDDGDDGDDGDHNESQKDEPDRKPDRPFVATTMQSEAVETIVQFLKRLAGLQERAHQQNPLQDKRSRRLVLGLHEVKRGLLSKKIRLLIVATDVEECGVLGEKLAGILAIAKRDQVPVAFPMTRRKLGRVLSKNVRVSCVGVYSFEGVNELFAQITRNVSTGASTGS